MVKLLLHDAIVIPRCAGAARVIVVVSCVLLVFCHYAHLDHETQVHADLPQHRENLYNPGFR